MKHWWTTGDPPHSTTISSPRSRYKLELEKRSKLSEKPVYLKIYAFTHYRREPEESTNCAGKRIFTKNLNYRNFNLKSLMKTRYNIPTLYENDSKQSLKNIVGAEITCKNLRKKTS